MHRFVLWLCTPLLFIVTINFLHCEHPMTKRDLEAQVRQIIDESDKQLTSDGLRARERELSEAVELRMDHFGNFFFVRKGAPTDLELISPLDRIVVEGLFDWKRPRKLRRYLELKADNKYSGPIMIAEGDSWFEHPLIPDLLDWAGRDYAALSLAKAGDTWSDILDEDFKSSETIFGRDVDGTSTHGR